MENEGKHLKNTLKGAGIEINDIAKTLGMTRQNLGYHFRKDVVDPVFKVRLMREYGKYFTNAKPETEYESKWHVETDYYKDRQKEVDLSTGAGKVITNTLKLNRRTSNALIPFYNADFMAGNSEQFYDDGTIYPEYYMDIPEFAGCTAFRAYSDSMEKRIRAGSILLGTKLEDWQSHLEYGQIYGITCHDRRRYLKYIRRADDPKKCLLLKSENPDYDDFELPREKIKNIWLIEGWLDKRT